MGVRNKKKLKRLNLLEMPNTERVQLIKGIKEKLQQRIVEVKLWQSLLDADNLTINGNVVYKENQQLSGFYLRHRV